MGLKILSWNINGLNDNKTEDADFVNKLIEYDIILLYESWTSEQFNFEIDGFTCYNFYRKFQHKKAKRCSGGIVIYIRDTIKNGIQIVKNNHDTIIWIKLKSYFFNNGNDIYLAGVYMWGEHSPAYNVVNTNLFDMLLYDVNYFSQRGRVLICGDLNARIGNGSRHDFIINDRNINQIDEEAYIPDLPLRRVSKDTVTNTHGIKLLDMCKACSLRIANGRLHNDKNVGEFTYHNKNGSSVIDYLLLKENDFTCINDFKVELLYEWSDHVPISFEIVCYDINKDKYYDSKQCSSHKWNEENKNHFRRNILGNLHHFNRITGSIDISCKDSINTCIEEFNVLLQAATEPLFTKTINVGKPTKKPCTNKAEWFDTECKNAKHTYRESLKVFDYSKTELSKRDMYIKKAYYKKIVKRKKALYKNKCVTEIENMRKSSPKEFWKLFKKKKPKETNDVSLEQFHKYFSDLHKDDTNVVNVDAERFCEQNIFENENCTYEELDNPITLDEIKIVVNNLKRNKAHGHDNLLNEYFLESFDILGGHLVDIFNAVFDSGIFPESWSKGVIIPIHKKGDKNNVNNYRGITLVSCFSKIFTGILNNRINNWIQDNEILSDAQFGFRKERSTVDAIFILNAVISKIINEKGRLYCAFIDLKMAFDNIYI